MFIVLHVANSNSPIIVNTDNISQVGITSDGSIVHRVDGGSVDVKEHFSDFINSLNANKISNS